MTKTKVPKPNMFPVQVIKEAKLVDTVLVFAASRFQLVGGICRI